MGKPGERMQEDVLVVLRRCGRPLSAYAVLGELRGTHPRIAPPTIYRALAALMKQGRVHRLESMKAFIACQCDRPSNASILSICDDCGIVEERTAPGVLEEISVIAGASGFRAARHVIEVHGTCASCGTERASA